MFDREGQLQAIAAAPDIDGTVLEFYAPYSNDGWEPGDEYYVLPYSRAEIQKLLPPEKGQRSASAED